MAVGLTLLTEPARHLQLYSVYHLNIAYSSIEEEQRAEVIRRCYWPLLKLAQKHKLPFGFESPAYTLEEIARLDPRWVAALRTLLGDGTSEFVGSGYAQLIGPLVPARVNAANLRIGNAVYQKLLGRVPEVALVNEQAYSAGLVKNYLDAGYRALIMEWDNPAKNHPEWNPDFRYLPQRACGPGGESIPLLWNKSIAFQRFQRYAHGEMELDEYLTYLGGHVGAGLRAFPLYANDVEIFDFRPGRYHTEAPLQREGEWTRLRRLFERLRQDPRFELVSPGSVLELLDEPGAGNRLHLESAENPVPVKKQGKYNIVRWAVTGRDDVGINTSCWRIFQRLQERPDTGDDDWRELCYLWSSDFRTHITERRWKVYLQRLAAFERRMGVPARATPVPVTEGSKAELPTDASRDGRFLTIRAERLTVKLNCDRGLAIDGVWLDDEAGPPLVGTLPHGFYDDISLGSDWYTGHVVLEMPGQPKVSDLSPVSPYVKRLPSGNWVISAEIPTPLGSVFKTVEISGRDPVLSLVYGLGWKTPQMGSLRLGNITLHPGSFSQAGLYYATCNGGDVAETFPLAGRTVNHGAAVSFLVSATCALGLTDGRFEFGDGRHRVIVDVDQAATALVGMVTYRETRGGYFCRLSLSASEMDETRRPDQERAENLEWRITLTFA